MALETSEGAGRWAVLIEHSLESLRRASIERPPKHGFDEAAGPDPRLSLAPSTWGLDVDCPRCDDSDSPDEMVARRRVERRRPPLQTLLTPGTLAAVIRGTLFAVNDGAAVALCRLAPDFGT